MLRMRIMEDLSGDWRRLDERIEHVTEEIDLLAHGSEKLPPIDDRTGHRPVASVVAAIGNGTAFAKGRDFAARLGMPKQMSTVDRTILRRQSLSPHAIHAGRSRYFAQASKLGKAQFWSVANGRGKPPASPRVGNCPCQ